MTAAPQQQPARSIPTAVVVVCTCLDRKYGLHWDCEPSRRLAAVGHDTHSLSLAVALHKQQATSHRPVAPYSTRGADDLAGDGDASSISLGMTANVEDALMYTMDRIFYMRCQRRQTVGTRSSPNDDDDADADASSDNTDSLCMSVVELQPEDNGAVMAMAQWLRNAGLRARDAGPARDARHAGDA